MRMVMANQLIVKVVMSFKPTSGHMSYNETTVSAMTDIMSETSTKKGSTGVLTLTYINLPTFENKLHYLFGQITQACHVICTSILFVPVHVPFPNMNIAPLRIPSQKVSHLPIPVFQVLC